MEKKQTYNDKAETIINNKKNAKNEKLSKLAEKLKQNLARRKKKEVADED